MTKKEFVKFIEGRRAIISYPNGRTFEGVVKTKSKEFTVNGLGCKYVDIKNIEATSCGIEFETATGFGFIGL